MPEKLKGFRIIRLKSKQAGTGPSRRHIQGSKIAKRLPSVKYSLLQYSKIENFTEKNFQKFTYSKKWTEWRAKVSQCRKTERGTLWNFPTSILSQNSKKIEGGTLWKKIPEKKSRSDKKLEGGPFGLAGYGMLRGKTGKTFLVQFARPNSAIWCNNIL